MREEAAQAPAEQVPMHVEQVVPGTDGEVQVQIPLAQEPSAAQAHGGMLRPRWRMTPGQPKWTSKALI